MLLLGKPTSHAIYEERWPGELAAGRGNACRTQWPMPTNQPQLPTACSHAARRLLTCAAGASYKAQHSHKQLQERTKVGRWCVGLGLRLHFVWPAVSCRETATPACLANHLTLTCSAQAQPKALLLTRTSVAPHKSLACVASAAFASDAT